MPDRCRTTYELSRMEGLSNKEIAARMGITSKAVERNMTRALRILRKNLAEYLAFLAVIAQLVK